MIAMVGLVAGVLLVSGIGSLVLTRQAAQRQATEQLVSEAKSAALGTSHAEAKATLNVIRRVLKLTDARLVRVNRFGVVITPLPPGLTQADLHPQNLLAGLTISGSDGNLAYAAAPVSLSLRQRRQLTVGGTLAVVLTRQSGSFGPSWSYFIIAGGVALLLAALVAWQMSRRMSRPLVAAVDATARIAAGDLDSRVPEHAGDYAEFTLLAHSINVMAQSLADGRVRERQLLLSVSHDLRTPLTSIRGFAEAITDGAIDDAGHAAEVISAEARRLERLVGDLLDLTKLEAKQLSLQSRPTDLSEVVGTTAEGFRPLAEKNRLALSVSVPAEPLAPVAADPDRLAQVLANLIENAFTFARGEVTVTHGPGTEPGTQVITVGDDGPGISPEDLRRVFERFYQADRGPNRKVGSGLGLAIVAELVAVMGGTVRVESPLGPAGGTRFVLVLLG
jgi:signal transduction histidine kinase